MNTKIIKLDINNKMYETITAKQGDTESRFLLFHLFDASLPFDLTEKSVRIYGIKPDGTKIFNDLVINDVKKGYCTLKLTNQMLAIAGLVKLELVIYSGNKKLSSIPFVLNVISSLNSDDAVVSTNEFTALMNGLAALSEYDIYKSNAKQVPGIKEEVSNLSSQLDTKASYIIANNFIGIDDSVRIQKALDSNFPISGTKIVVIEAKNKYSNDGKYTLSKPLKIPSNTCLKLEGCYLKLASGVNNAIINNSDFDGGNENIHIIGIGNPILDCNRSGQNLSLNNYKNIGLHLYNVDNFSIKGVTLKDCPRWSLVPERATNGFIDEIVFDNVGEVNQDGVHILGPSSNITVTKIRGVIGDDACVVNARLAGQGTNVYQGYGVGGDVKNVIFDDINITGGINSHTGILRTSGSLTTVIDGITLSNAIGNNLTDGILRIGGNDEILMENHKNITVNNVQGYEGDRGGVSLINMLQPVSNLSVNNAHITSTRKRLINANGKNIDSLNLSNITMELIGSEEETTTIKSVLGFANATISNLNMTNIIINYKLVESLAYSYIFDLAGTTLINCNLDNFVGKHIRSIVRRNVDKETNVTHCRLNNININEDYYKTGFNREENLEFIINGIAYENGENEYPSNYYQIGDTINYFNTTNNKYYTFIYKGKETFINVTDYTEAIKINGEKHYCDFGTIPSKGYKTIILNVDGSQNNIIYQIKPGFDLRGGLLYSYSNKTSDTIKLTIFNAMDSDYTFSETENVWMSIKTIGIF